MPLNEETEAILKDLESSGFDLTTVRQQARGNPLLENAANAKLGGGLLRREEFTKYKTAKEEEVSNLRTQIQDLAAMKDSLAGFKDNSELYEAMLEKIEVYETNLIEAGFSPDDVKNLSFKEKSTMKSALDLAKKQQEIQNPANPPKEEEIEMPNKDFVDSATMQTALANLAGGSIISTVRIQRQLDRAARLGVEVTDELIAKFEQNLLSGIEGGKTFEAIADETFGFSAKEKEINEAEIQKRIDAQVRERTAEALKDAGVSTSRVSVNRARSPMHNLLAGHGIRTDAELAIEGEGGTAVINGKKVPVNKQGDVEFYRLRGSKGERMEHASNYLGELEEKHPELAEDVY